MEIPLPGPRLPCEFTHVQRKCELKSVRLRSKLVKECLQADIPIPLRWPLEYLDGWADTQDAQMALSTSLLA